MRSSLVIRTLAITLVASPLAAQRLDRRAAAPLSSLGSPSTSYTLVVDTTRHASRASYVLGGAAAGAFLAGVGFALHDEEDDAFFYGLAVAATITASALVGASIGWIVYAIRY